MNGYITMYNGKRHEVRAETLLAAKEAALAHFKPPKSRRHDVIVVLAEKDDKPVTHSTAEFG